MAKRVLLKQKEQPEKRMRQSPHVPVSGGEEEEAITPAPRRRITLVSSPSPLSPASPVSSEASFASESSSFLSSDDDSVSSGPKQADSRRTSSRLLPPKIREQDPEEEEDLGEQPEKQTVTLASIQRSEKARIRKIQKDEQMEADREATISKLLHKQTPKRKKTEETSKPCDEKVPLGPGQIRWISNQSGFFLCYPGQ